MHSEQKAKSSGRNRVNKNEHESKKTEIISMTACIQKRRDDLTATDIAQYLPQNRVDDVNAGQLRAGTFQFS